MGRAYADVCMCDKIDGPKRDENPIWKGDTIHRIPSFIEHLAFIFSFTQQETRTRKILCAFYTPPRSPPVRMESTRYKECVTTTKMPSIANRLPWIFARFDSAQKKSFEIFIFEFKSPKVPKIDQLRVIVVVGTHTRFDGKSSNKEINQSAFLDSRSDLITVMLMNYDNGAIFVLPNSPKNWNWHNRRAFHLSHFFIVGCKKSVRKKRRCHRFEMYQNYIGCFHILALLRRRRPILLGKNERIWCFILHFCWVRARSVVIISIKCASFSFSVFSRNLLSLRY